MPNQTNDPLAKKLLHAAWMSIALGLTIEIALVITAAVFGNLKSATPFLADLAGKTSWAVLVCVGISVGLAASQARPQAMGLLGLLSAPIAFLLAKVVHKSVAQALAVQIPMAVPGPFTFAAIRAAEYAILGLAVGLISKRLNARLRDYALMGLAAGVVFGSLILGLTLRLSANPPPTAALAAKGVNEVLFPLGCSIVLYAANALGSRVRLAAAV